ncbi:MAG: helix-turn-helix domain-containing protein [Bacteroides sp.]|nr:helix-turn-helix domain-containing protein [Prevotella sp.]MCM1407387.1 helix-turn-helix domain-containing protein [Treponema brennaborense]MCM1469877.1 helix-turn-helix domain-containing protein [Bacteroides sp.]
MESFGEILRNAREQKQIDLSKAERETSISLEFLDALEAERSDIFPGEPYFIGFLRNYSEYLGVDADKMISLYRAKKIQEAPVPEGLLKDKSSGKWIPVVVTAVCCVVFGAGAFLYHCFFPQEKTSPDAVVDSGVKAARYVLSAEPVQKRIYQGDVIVIPGEHETELTVHETHTELALMTSAGLQYIQLGEEAEIDADGSANTHAVFYVSDISTSDASFGAEVRMFLKTAAAEQAVPSLMPERDENAEETADSPSFVKKSGEQIVVFESTYAYPITVTATFRGACLFRYRSDRSEPVEAYYTAGNTLNIQARNSGVRIWMSDANMVKLRVIGDAGHSYDLEIGYGGQVSVNDIKWIRDTDGRYKLVVTDVD